MKLKITGKGMTRAAFKEFAPDIFRGFIIEHVEDKSAVEVGKFLESASMWDLVPENQKRFLISYAPWPVEWLDTKWVIESIAKGNKAAALLIVTSPELQAKITESVREIKEKVGEWI
jgi:hypothetical protein